MLVGPTPRVNRSATGLGGGGESGTLLEGVHFDGVDGVPATLLGRTTPWQYWKYRPTDPSNLNFLSRSIVYL